MGLGRQSSCIEINSNIFAIVRLFKPFCTFNIFIFEFLALNSFLVMQGGSLSSVTTLMGDFQAFYGLGGCNDWIPFRKAEAGYACVVRRN